MLSGGGARGAYQAGVLCELCRHVEFDIVCGTSVGALNGALVAQGDLTGLAQLWHEIGSLDVLEFVETVGAARAVLDDVRRLRIDPIRKQPRDLVDLYRHSRQLGAPSKLLRLKSIFDAAPIAALVRDRLHFDALERTLIVSATNLSRGGSEAFYAFQPQGSAAAAAFCRSEAFSQPITPANYVPCLLASAAIPGAFSPVELRDAAGNTNYYIDGAVANSTPIRQAIDAGADDITIVTMIGPNACIAHDAMSVPEVAFAATEIAQARLVDLDLKLARAVNDAVRADPSLGKRHVDLRVIAPKETLPVRMLEFGNQAAIDIAFERGTADAQEALRDALQPVPVYRNGTAH